MEQIKLQLQELGFDSHAIERAIRATNSGTFDQCLEYILSNQDQPNSVQRPNTTFTQNHPNNQYSQFRQQAYERRREEFMQIKLKRQQEAQKRKEDFEMSRKYPGNDNMRDKFYQQMRKNQDNQTQKNSPQIDHNHTSTYITKQSQDYSPPPVCNICNQANNSFSVICPVGISVIEPIKQSKRLDNFEGKTIAIVGGSFMASITHPELKRLITKEFPSTKVFIFNEVGSAGVFPGPSIKRKSIELFQEKLKKLNVDAVISGNGGCGLCTPKETGSSIAAEYIGIPSVTIAGPGFADQVVQTMKNNGINDARVAVYPGAFALHSRDELIMNTDRVLWPQIKDLLTRPINNSKESIQNETIDPLQTVFSGSIDEVNRYFIEMNWSDGLPIIPPTIDRINEFLKFAGISYDTHIAVLPIAHRKTLAIHVAANGVMSGCKPEFMPILVALTKALGSPDFRRTLSSTHAWNPFCLINGPVVRQLGIDFGQGEISEEFNAMIGRFMNLALKNLSGYYIKSDRMGTFGYLMPWCLAEDEEACLRVGWNPYHVQNGYKKDDNVLTVSSALLWGNNMAPSTNDPNKLMNLICWDITERCQFALGSGKQFTYRTILLTEPVASILSKSFKSKEIFEKKLILNSRRPLHERAYANYYANPGSSIDPEKLPFLTFEKQIAVNEQAELTQIPEWHAKPENSKESKIMTIPVMQDGMTAIIVTGDCARNKVQIMPGGGFASVLIEIPKNWNELMQEAGYEPLDKFILH